MKHKKALAVFLFVIPFTCKIKAQDLLSQVEDSLPKTEKVAGAFKSTRVINAHSTEMLAKGSLDFRILHRFGLVNAGVDQFFGLDDASMRMSIDYGVTNNFTIGLGRSTFRKELDLFVKTRILQQTKGAIQMPVSIVLAAGYLVWTEKSFDAVKPGFSDRSSYYLQLIAGRKCTGNFSFQLSPIVVHSGTPADTVSSQTVFAIGGGARYKFNKRMAFTIDYHHPFGTRSNSFKDPLSVGIDIETGGHVFQLHFSNAVGMNERAYITQTIDDFFKGDIRFGFNLSRMFYIKKNKYIKSTNSY